MAPPSRPQFQRLPLAGGALLYDPARVREPGEWLFDRVRWRREGRLTEQAGGRGSICFVDHGAGQWALRRYLRGGLPAKVSREHYLFLGEARTRSFAELRLLGDLQALGLPVPGPVAAAYRRHGPLYVAELLTERLPATGSLTEALLAGRVTAHDWAAVGRCLRRFHDAGAQHADLNANNIMLGPAGEVWLLDFDRGRLRAPAEGWQRRVLARLARSLAKVSRGRDTGWQAGHAALVAAHDGA